MSEQDPSLIPKPGIAPSGEVLAAFDHQLAVYDIPKPPDFEERWHFERVAVDNAEGFGRLVQGGLDALQDGETVKFAGIYAGDKTSRIRIVKREGDNFRLENVDPFDEDMAMEIGQSEPAPEQSDQQIALDKEEINNLFDGLRTNPNYSNYMSVLINRGDQLGEAVHAMGYSDQKDVYPMPLTLQGNIHRMRQEGGADIPDIEVFNVPQIESTPYVHAWSEGKFPVSGKIEWFSHDAMQDHATAVTVFGNDAMDFGQLYAQAAEASDEITYRKYKDEYQGNNPDIDTREVVDITVSGDKKMDAAAEQLDNYTAELYRMASYGTLDREPYSDEIKTGHEYDSTIDKMAKIIMASPEHKEKLVEYLDRIGSKALTDGKFSHDTFLRELLGRAQQKWGITPKAPEPPKEVDLSDPFAAVG
jgi:hypothetical protein